MATLDLRSIRLRSGEQLDKVVELELEPVELGGQRYVPDPVRPQAPLTITCATSGTVFRLRFGVALRGPCFRCLTDSAAQLTVDGTEYEAAGSDTAEELHTEYLADDILDLGAWARDAIVLSLPEQILCREECSGLCGRCGADLNASACTCGPPDPDPRWQQLEALKEQLDAPGASREPDPSR